MKQWGITLFLSMNVLTFLSGVGLGRTMLAALAFSSADTFPMIPHAMIVMLHHFMLVHFMFF